MWANLPLAAGWMLAWLLPISGAYFLFQPSNPAFQNWAKLTRYGLLIVLGLALVVRAVPMLVLPVGAGYDIQSFQLVANARLAGEEVYNSAAIWRHPYLPFQMYLIGFSMRLARWTEWPFVVWVKLPAILADMGICTAVYYGGYQLTKSRITSLSMAMVYALNPIPVLVAAYHGQFDAIPVLFILLAWILWERHPNKLLAAVALGLGILNKTWPIIIWPVFILRLWQNQRRQLLPFILVSLGIPTVVTAAYILIAQPVKLNPMLGRALTHTGPDGYWGWSSLLAVAKLHGLVDASLYGSLLGLRRHLIVLAGATAVFLTHRTSIPKAILVTLLAVFAVTAGMGIQWIMWIVPFAILTQQWRWLRWYTFGGTFFILAQLYGLHFYPWAHQLWGVALGDQLIRLSSIFPWIIIVLWCTHTLYTLVTSRNS